MDLGLEEVQEFFKMLQGGDIPEGMTMPHQPKLDIESAYSVIRFLQEHLEVIPIEYIKCQTLAET